MSTDFEVVALHPGTPAHLSLAILGAMAFVAEAGEAPLRSEDVDMIRGAWRFIFGETSGLDMDCLARVEPQLLASLITSASLREDAIKFMTVMTCIDGVPEGAKIDAVRRYTAALHIEAPYLRLLGLASAGHMKDALAEMTRLNMDSITNGQWTGGDSNAWLLPYVGRAADPALAARFHALSEYPSNSFGRAFHHQFTSNNYDFPGEATGLNAGFSVPHDSAHVITGYDTTPRGEILVSVFTSTMHNRLPMGAHVLPVIFMWHLHIQINPVAGKAATPMDPRNFWCAWAAGAASQVDTFAPGWDFWAFAERSLAEVRKIFGIPADGLEAWADANRGVVKSR